MSRTARLILAAGEGRRMGGAVKALLDIRGKSALERIAELAIGDGPTWVVTGFAADLVRREAHALGLQTVHNPDWRQGQLSSVQCGLRALDADVEAVLIHPVDLPLVRQDDVDRLLEAWRREDEPRPLVAVVTHHRRRGHPLLLHRTLFDEVLDLGDDRSLRDVVRAQGDAILHVPVENPGILRDLDRPEDWRATRS